MKVDFNNMRLQLARAFNNLTSKLNALQSDIDEPHYVQKEHLQKIAEAATDLQNYIGGLLCVYDCSVKKFYVCVLLVYQQTNLGATQNHALSATCLHFVDNLQKFLF